MIGISEKWTNIFQNEVAGNIYKNIYSYSVSLDNDNQPTSDIDKQYQAEGLSVDLISKSIKDYNEEFKNEQIKVNTMLATEDLQLFGKTFKGPLNISGV